MKRDTRQLIIEKGLDVVLHKGFHHTGLQEILKAAEVPKGSFYHFFKSKEEFGLNLIEYYANHKIDMTRKMLEHSHESPSMRLRQFFEDGFAELEANDFSGGCFLANMTQELAGQSDVFAQALEKKWREQRTVVANCIWEAQRCGEVVSTTSAEAVAEFLINGFQGALMRAKAAKNRDAVSLFIDFSFDQLMRVKPITKMASVG